MAMYAMYKSLQITVLFCSVLTWFVDTRTGNIISHCKRASTHEKIQCTPCLFMFVLNNENNTHTLERTIPYQQNMQARIKGHSFVYDIRNSLVGSQYVSYVYIV